MLLQIKCKFFQVEQEDKEWTFCQKICKSKAGLKRHITVKHPAEKSGDRENTEQQQYLTPEIYTRIMGKAKEKILMSKIYTAKMK